MGEVTVSTADGVAVITVSSPGVHNALTPAMARELAAICAGIDADPQIGAAVVRGGGGTFCSGADTRDWGGMGDPAAPDQFAAISDVYDGFVRVGSLAVPVIAAVRGVAVGGGLNLALAADLRIVALNARLLTGFLRIGLHPGGGFFTLAGRLGGRETAAALGLFSQELSGGAAVAAGLAWAAVPDEEVEPRALELAREAARDPELTRHALAMFRRELGPPAVPWAAALEMERGIQMWSQHRRAQAAAARAANDGAANDGAANDGAANDGAANAEDS